MNIVKLVVTVRKEVVQNVPIVHLVNIRTGQDKRSVLIVKLDDTSHRVGNGIVIYVRVERIRMRPARHFVMNVGLDRIN